MIQLGISMGGGLTVDKSVEDELAVLLDQIVDVTENSTKFQSVRSYTMPIGLEPSLCASLLGQNGGGKQREQHSGGAEAVTRSEGRSLPHVV
jgi:hypothetical protein